MQCTNCGADWSRGQFGEECPQCGGGALERSCLVCRGRCGATWKRAVLDSQDENEAHWIGGCGLPQDEQIELMKQQYGRGAPDCDSERS